MIDIGHCNSNHSNSSIHINYLADVWLCVKMKCCACCRVFFIFTKPYHCCFQWIVLGFSRGCSSLWRSA